jgi:hypothetical protein
VKHPGSSPVHFYHSVMFRSYHMSALLSWHAGSQGPAFILSCKTGQLCDLGTIHSFDIFPKLSSSPVTKLEAKVAQIADCWS